MSGVLLLAGLLLLAAACLRMAGVLTPPRLALALLMLAAPLEVYRTDTVVGNVSLFRLALVFAAVVALRDPRRLVRTLRHPVMLSLVALCALMLLSALALSSNRGLAVAVAGQAIVGTASVGVIVALASRCEPRDVLAFFCLGATFALGMAIWQGVLDQLGGNLTLPFLDQLPLPEGLEASRIEAVRMATGQLRLRAAFGDPNHFAGYLVLAGAAGLAFTMTLRRGSSAAKVAVAWLVIVALVLIGTLSRSGWVAAGVAAVLFAIPLLRSPGVRAQLFGSRRRLLAGLAALVVLTAVAYEPVFSRVSDSSGVNTVSNSEHERTASSAFDSFKSAPVLGIGLADLGPLLQQKARTSGAHSSFLTVGAELGAVGLLALLAIFGTVLMTLLKASRTAIGRRWVFLCLACGYAGFAVGNLFYDLYLDDYHFAFIGLAVAMAATAAQPLEAAWQPDELPVGPDADHAEATEPAEPRQRWRLRLGKKSGAGAAAAPRTAPRVRVPLRRR